MDEETRNEIATVKARIVELACCIRTLQLLTQRQNSDIMLLVRVAEKD